MPGQKINPEAKLKLENTISINQSMLNSLHILQMDSLALETYIAEQLQENPVLEFPLPQGNTADRTDWEYVHQSDFNDYETLEFFLLDQLKRKKIPEKTMGFCKALVRLLDQNGYLQTELIPEAYFQNPEYARALEILQGLEPAGVGARDLKECLLLQLSGSVAEDSLAVILVKNHLEDISRRNYTRIQRVTGASMEELHNAIQRILALNPRPGAAFLSREKTAYVRPDFTISVKDGQIAIVQEERSFPALTISDYYLRLYKNTEDPKVKQYLKERIRSAQKLVTGLENRKTTTRRCLEAIVQVQQSFFLNPSRQLIPLKLETVSQMVDLHISTVSRAVGGKYLEFEGKTYPMKFFFVRGIQDGKEQVATSQIRELIRQIIGNEDPEKTLSDQQIVHILQQGGNPVSRRTVAKYRDIMGIPSSKQRRKL